MARGHLTFKKSDLTRAIKAAETAGKVVERAWIERDGKIVLDFIKPTNSIVTRDGSREIVL